MIRLSVVLVLATAIVAAPATAQQGGPNDPATLCTSSSNPDIAIANCTKLIETPVDSVNGFAAIGLAFDSRANAYFNKGDYDRAIADYSEAIRRNPANSEAFDNCGTAYSNQQDYLHAIPDFTASLRLNPKEARALYARGIAKQATGDISGAGIDIASAKRIDPNAGNFATFVPSAAPADTSAVCEIPSESAKASQSSEAAPMPAYVVDSIDQLKREVPALRGIRLEAPPANTGTAPLQDQSTAILSRTGAEITAQFKRMPNLIAKEEVKHPAASSLSGPDDMIDAPHKNYGASWIRQPQSDGTDSVHVFTYRLVPSKSSTVGQFVREYRLDAHNQPLSSSADSKNNPRSIGFATSWLLFLPANLHESTFRYLGQQKIRNHQTYVLAFAQIPGRVLHGTVVQTARGSCSTLIQGIVWIDQATSQIVHLQTDLLSPLPGIHMQQLRAILNYSQVKIPQRNLLLWLPSDVETTWSTAYNEGDERHTYTNYRLFTATSRLVIPDETSTH